MQAGRRIWLTRVSSPLGPLFVARTERGICCLSLTAHSEAEFGDEIRRMLARGRGRAADGSAAVRAAASPSAAPPAWEPDSPAARAQLQAELADWFAGRSPGPPVDYSYLPPFSRAVMDAVRAIPRGQTCSYGEVARRVGRPGAARAVGQVMARNPVPLLVPCHRVVPADGRLGAYSGGGPSVKGRLLAIEGAPGVAPPPPRRRGRRGRRAPRAPG